MPKDGFMSMIRQQGNNSNSSPQQEQQSQEKEETKDENDGSIKGESPARKDLSTLFAAGDSQDLKSLMQEQDELLEAYEENQRDIIANEKAQRLKLEQQRKRDVKLAQKQ